MSARYELRPAREGDLNMLSGWLSQPHVSPWFEDAEPDVEDLRDARISMWIAMLDSCHFAFVHDYDIHAWSPHHFDLLPIVSRGLDMYIGEPHLTGLGHGSRLLRQHSDHLLKSGAPALGIDPHPDNHAAIRSFEKAGFAAASGPTDTEWGRVILMTRRA